MPTFKQLAAYVQKQRCMTELSKETGVDADLLRRIKRGERGSVSYETGRKIALHMEEGK